MCNTADDMHGLWRHRITGSVTSIFMGTTFLQIKRHKGFAVLHCCCALGLMRVWWCVLYSASAAGYHRELLPLLGVLLRGQSAAYALLDQSSTRRSTEQRFACAAAIAETKRRRMRAVAECYVAEARRCCSNSHSHHSNLTSSATAAATRASSSDSSSSSGAVDAGALLAAAVRWFTKAAER